MEHLNEQGGQANTLSSDISIGVAIITKDRLNKLKQLLPQLSKLDQVVVVDTSPVPDNKTRQYVKKLGRPFEFYHYAWRNNPEGYEPNDWGFAAARNFSFSKLKTQYALWLDTDDRVGLLMNGREVAASAEMVSLGFRKIIAEAPADTSMWFMEYIYSHDDYGNANVTQMRERLVRLDMDWHWIYPIHECLVANNPVKFSGIKDIKIIHTPEGGDGPAIKRNIEYLQKWYDQLIALGSEVDQMDLSRCRFQIGLSLWGQNKWLESANWLEGEFLAKHQDANILERWHSNLIICRDALELADLDRAEEAALEAIRLKPSLAEGNIFLALVKLLREDDPRDIIKLLEYTSMADDTPLEVVQNPLDQTFVPYCIMADCKLQLGELQSALQYIERAVSLCPSDPRALNLYQKIATEIKQTGAVDATLAMFKYLYDYEENEKAAKLYDLLPYVVQEKEEIRVAALEARERVSHILGENADKEYEQLYKTGGRYETFDDEELEKGIVPGEDRFSYIVKRLKQNPNIKTVLDVGCSDGFHSLALAKLGYQVVGIDLDPKAIEIANERAQKLGLDATFMQGFFERMSYETIANPYGEGSFFHGFDAVISEEVIEHVQEPRYFLDSLTDCAKDGAPIIITTPDGSFGMGFHPDAEIDNKSVHVRAFTQATLEQLLHLSPEYRVVECHYIPFKAEGGRRGWRVAEIRRETRPEGPIVRIVCGNSTSFTPDSLDEEGTGGSETAVIHMARAWAAMGCQVVVYGAKIGIWDGVFYRNVEELNLDHPSDLFIAWRLPQLFTEQRPNAVKTVLWAHDLHYPTEINETTAERIDVVAVLSKFHENHFVEHHPATKGKIWVTRNGIAASRYQQPVEKVPHRYFYSSSYDRGLDELLNVWPEIKAEIPDAELHVAYGLETARIILTRNKEWEKLEGLEALTAKMDAMDGVTHHNRLNQIELAQLQSSCEAWLYPPNGFLETYCITALEAQAAGAIPVTRLNGALPEIVKFPVPWHKMEEIVPILKVLKPTKAVQKAREWALTQTWNALAVEWLNELKPKEEVASE